MLIIDSNDANLASKLSEWAKDAYVRCCHQVYANQWTAEAAGYPDGRIECYNIQYGNSTSEDIYYERAFSLLVVQGERLDNLETEADYDDDAEAYEDEINDYINTTAENQYGIDSDVISMALVDYQDWRERINSISQG